MGVQFSVWNASNSLARTVPQSLGQKWGFNLLSGMLQMHWCARYCSHLGTTGGSNLCVERFKFIGARVTLATWARIGSNFCLERFNFMGARITSASRIRMEVEILVGTLGTSATWARMGSNSCLERFKFIGARVTSATWARLGVQTYGRNASNSLARTCFCLRPTHFLFLGWRSVSACFIAAKPPMLTIVAPSTTKQSKTKQSKLRCRREIISCL